MSDNNGQGKSFIGTRILAIILVLLVLVSAVFAGLAVHKQVTTSDVISLTPEESKNTIYNIFYRPMEGDPSGAINDGSTEWTGKTNVNLFKSSYTNNYGSTKVEATNNDKVIAPGTSNTYSFTIANKGNIDLKYTMSLSGLFGLVEKNVPITLRLRKGDEWLFGSDTEWVNAKQIANTTKQTNITTGTSDVYTLEWSWPYESGSDGEDSTLGNGSVNTDNDFTITITTVAEVADGAAEVDEHGNLLYRRTIEPSLFGWLVAVGVGLVLLIIVFAVYRAKKRKQQ